MAELRESLASYLGQRGAEGPSIDPAAVTSTMLVIDVRPFPEYPAGHFPAAVSMPMPIHELEQRLEDIPTRSICSDRGTLVTTRSHARRASAPEPTTAPGDESVDVELLVVPDCPHQGPAAALVHRALEELDMGTEVTVTEIRTDHEATLRRFTGSPTFLVDGTDVLPRSDAAFAIACRLYATPAGLAPLPTLAQLSAALQRAADVSTGPPAGRARPST